tara:strand:+ start:434 stop:661 length:228 start_codon:yes stop_codon:yes gene_type:complete
MKKSGLITILIVVFFLAGCAEIAAIEGAAQIGIDKATDRAYGLSCNLRYKTERRFMARHDINRETINDWCKRVSQ